MVMHLGREYMKGGGRREWGVPFLKLGRELWGKKRGHH